MKQRTLYLALLALLALAGCMRDQLDGRNDLEDDGDGVTLTFRTTIPDAPTVATRALGDIEAAADKAAYLERLKLYIFVFEDTGSPESNYLRELVYEPKILSREVNSGTLTFRAKFDGTAENAILHIVATTDPEFEEQLRTVADRSELGIFSGATGLYSKDAEAYWRRIELEMPINNENKDNINAQLAPVRLIRNFARVNVKLKEDFTKEAAESGITPEEAKRIALRDFMLEGFVVVNAADCGYVAAYNENVVDENGEKPGFITDGFEDAHTALATDYYGYLTNTLHYVPARHPQSHRIHADDKSDWYPANDGWNKEAKYLFERPYQDQHKSFILVKGYFGANSANSRYIKLDIGTVNNSPDDEGQPFGVFETFNVVRNISYDVTISEMLSEQVGHDNPESAIVSPPSNNISTSIETRKMLNIYDGIDHMQVNATTIVIVDKEVQATDETTGEPKFDFEGKPVYITVPNPDTDEMRWRYFTNYDVRTGFDGTLSNGLVKWNYPGFAFEYDRNGDPKNGTGDPEGIFAKVYPLQTFAPSAADRLSSGNNYDWLGFKLEYNTPKDDVVRQKTVRLYAPDGLTRDVTFILRKRWEFVNTIVGADGSKYDSNVEVYPGSYSYENGYTMPAETLAEMREIVPPGYVGSQRGAQLTVMFELPGDIPQALFPLQFKIGFDRQNVEPATIGSATVIYGDSMFDDDPEGFAPDVPRMQFIKTVDWAYYNGSGEPGDTGHKIVTVRFKTTNNLLATSDVDKESVTRVRVTNPYFILGEDSFERKVADTDPDPTRLLWYWNFSYPEWATDHLPGSGSFGAAEFDGLWHTNGTRKNEDGVYVLMSSGHSEQNPEFEFNVGTDLAQAPFTATLTIKGASEEPRNFNGTKYYRREAYVKVVIKKADGTSEPRYYYHGDTYGNDLLFFAYSGGIGTVNSIKTIPQEKSCKIPVAQGEILESIVIWSRMHPGDNEEKETRYYSIKLKLIPN